MSRRFTIRFSENSALHIQNVARLYHVSISTVIKAMTMNSINAILDKDGNYTIADGVCDNAGSASLKDRRRKNLGRKSSVLEIISKNYPKLKQLCDVSGILVADKEDDFEQTILLLTDDEKVSDMSEKDVLEYFKYKYNMVRFRTTQENKSRKEIPFADNMQTKKETEED